MSYMDYLEYAYEWDELVGKFDTHVIRSTKNPTNPPEVIYIREAILCLPIYCEDGWYVRPVNTLSDNLLWHRQHRTLRGFLDSAG